VKSHCGIKFPRLVSDGNGSKVYAGADPVFPDQAPDSPEFSSIKQNYYESLRIPAGSSFISRSFPKNWENMVSLYCSHKFYPVEG
jgi:hypothetical protein